LESEGWRFDSFTLVRARRVAHLETCFDADPQLAALTADLIEEVARLRKQLEMR
jgi:chaperone modulatory protein CbpM